MPSPLAAGKLIADEGGFANDLAAAAAATLQNEGMYRDPGDPLTYDMTTRLQFANRNGLGCSHLEHISGKTFVEKASELSTPTYSTIYIGTAGGNAYLQEWIMLPWERTNVLWTPLNDLPPAVAKELKSGKNPWALSATTDPSK